MDESRRHDIVHILNEDKQACVLCRIPVGTRSYLVEPGGAFQLTQTVDGRDVADSPVVGDYPVCDPKAFLVWRIMNE